MALRVATPVAAHRDEHTESAVEAVPVDTMQGTATARALAPGEAYAVQQPPADSPHDYRQRGRQEEDAEKVGDGAALQELQHSGLCGHRHPQQRRPSPLEPVEERLPDLHPLEEQEDAECNQQPDQDLCPPL